VSNSKPDTNNEKMEFEDITVPPLPSAFQVIFRCKDCDYRWKLEMELPVSLSRFFRQNSKCYSCNNTNIEMDIIPKQYQTEI